VIFTVLVASQELYKEGEEFLWLPKRDIFLLEVQEKRELFL
jgi:hypothetical protein